MDLQLILALATGKLIAALIKLKGGGATAAPGLYALKVDPNLVKKLSTKIKNGAIIVTGTNGKTTTSRLIADILDEDFKIIHNRQGSNLLRGIASTLILESTIFGTLSKNLAIWEVDEATLPEAIQNTNPKVIVLLNLFRDQLDRYGEIDTTRNKWQKALEMLPISTIAAINADDPSLAYIAKKFKGEKIFFGVEDNKINLPEIEHVADIKYCPQCRQKLIFTSLFSAHLGKFYCPNDHLKRPEPNISATDLVFNSDFSTQIALTVNNEQLTVNFSLPGLYNIYNILAAASVAPAFKKNLKHVKKKLENFQPVFGRFQKINIKNRSVLIFLIKNPAGANEVLRLLATKNNLNLLTILNDNIADGRDVSWIWDTNWEVLKNKMKNISTSGTRAWDLALRIKYAGIKMDKKSVYGDISSSIKANVSKLDNNDTLIILPTYTSLLTVQNTLHKLGGITKWQNQ